MKRVFMGISAFLMLALFPLSASALPIVSKSHNWSGYALSAGSYTAIKGGWTIPYVTPSSAHAGDATWIGIGGLHSSDLIQIGTRAYTLNGQVGYQAWYEILPQQSTPIPLSINPGDTMNAALTEVSKNVWQFSLTDATTGRSFTTTMNYRSSHSSAEWIEELPRGIGESFTLARFGSITFSNVIALRHGVNVTPAGISAKRLVMVGKEGLALATPLPYASYGFTVVRN